MKKQRRKYKRPRPPVRKPNLLAKGLAKLANMIMFLALITAGYRKRKKAPKLQSWHWLNTMRNEPCMCKSGKKFKRCCLKKYQKIRDKKG